MGLSNSAQSFQRLIDSVLRGVSNCFVYLDDILVYNEDEESHMKTIEEIFARLEKNGLTLALDKCEFGKDSLDYLGYTVNSQGILPIKKKVSAIENFPVPIKQKQLLAFLGSLNFYRASLPKTEPSEEHPQPRAPAEVLDPLYKLATAKITNSSFKKEWDSDKKFQSAFDTAKKLLVNAVMINHPVPSAPLALTTDASNYCLGAALDQWVDGAWRPLGFWSKMLRPSQQKYTTYLRELLAIKLSMRHFDPEINGRRLTIYTDWAQWPPTTSKPTIPWP